MPTKSATKTAESKPARVLKKKVTVVEPPPPLHEKKEREINPITGFTVGSDSDVIAEEIIRGGESREEIARRIASRLEPTSRTGTPKPIANLMSGVIRRLKERGYVIESSWKMTNPDLPKPRSRRAKTS